MSTHDAHSINLERETIEALYISLCKQIALFNDNMKSSTVLGDGANVSSLTALLNRGSMEARIKAAVLIEKLANIDREATMKMIVLGSNSVISGLFNLLREDHIPNAVKASLSALAALYNGATEEEEIMPLMTEEKGFGVAVLIEQLAGARRAKGERVLTVLKAISLSAQGQAALSEHALTIPVLVRSLLVLSALANEVAICVLWVLCLHNRGGGSTLGSALIHEAAHLGVAHKLLVVAQMECSLPTKNRIRDLLKAMSASNCLPRLYGSQRL